MGRKKQVRTLNVYLNGALVGRLRKETSGAIAFRYAEEWIETSFAISHSLPVQEEEYKGEIVTRYFDNLLPDNDDIKEALATKFGAESTRPFDILSVIGRDCVGALSFLPEDAPAPVDYEFRYKKLTTAQIAKRIKNLSWANPLGLDKGEFRLSLAGAQEKTALLRVDGGWAEPLGSTPTTHIIKTAIGALNEEISFHDSVDNEWLSLLVCRKFGLPTCHTWIENFQDQRVLVVERFDRKWTKHKGKEVLIRIPQEDMCQALGVSPYRKYQSEGGPSAIEISDFLKTSKRADDRSVFFKALLVFDLLYAPDGHAKNFSVSMAPSGLELTPLYDVMGGYFLHKREKRPIQKLKLAMGIGKSNYYSFQKIAVRHYKETGSAFGLSKTEVEKTIDEFRATAERLSFSAKELDKNLNQETLDILMEGIDRRRKWLFP